MTKRHLAALGIALSFATLFAVSVAQAQRSPISSTRFTPVAGDDSVKRLADSLGNTPEERQQILQLAGAGQELFAQKYKGKWNNTIAGAMTFFVVASHIVSTGEQPSGVEEERLFDSISTTLANSEIMRASDKEKTALYNTLLAGAGLPLVVYVDAKQNNNTGQLEQAKVMAAGFSRKFFNMEPQALREMLESGRGTGVFASATGTAAGNVVASNGPSSSGTNGIDGR